MKRRVAVRRLLAECKLTLAVVLALGVCGAMVAMAAGWLWTHSHRDLPFRDLSSLWFVQVTEPGSLADQYGPEMQASLDVLSRFVGRQDVFEPLMLATEQALEVAVGGPGASGRPEREKILDHTPNLDALLGVRPVAGRPARPGHQEVTISTAFARKHFGTPAAAVGNRLSLGEASMTVTGVWDRDFVAPSLLRPQLRPDDGFSVYRPVQRPLQRLAAADKDRAAPWLVVGRSAQPESLLDARVRSLIGDIASEAGAWGIDVNLRPLRAHMLGNSHRIGLGLLVAAAVLAASTVLGVVLITAARFAQRAGYSIALRASGATPAEQWGFERQEAVLLATASGLIGLACLGLLPPLLGSAEFAQSLGEPALLVRSGVFLLLYVLLITLMLNLVAAFVTPVDNGWKQRLQARVGLSRTGLRGAVLRLFQLPQILVAAVSVMVLATLVEAACSTLRAANSVNYDGIEQWAVHYPPGVDAPMIAQDLEQLRRRVAASPAVRSTAISLASPLDWLSGYGVGYSGPRWRGEHTVEQVREDGSYIVRERAKAADSTIQNLRYTLMLAPVEPEFFSILGHQPLRGRLFDTTEEDVTVLTPAATSVLFEPSEPVIDNQIPAGPRTEDKSGALSLWHGKVRVVGEIADRRIHRAVATLDPVSQYPVAFVPYRLPPSRASHQGLEAYLLVMMQPGSAAPRELIEGHLEDSLVSGSSIRPMRLEQEKHRRIAEQLVSSIGTLVFGVLVVLTTALSAWGSGYLTAHYRRREIAVRLAVGADPGLLLRQVFSRELLWPLCLLLTCLVAALVVGAVGQAAGVAAMVPVDEAVLAVLLVALSVAIGAYAGIRGPLLRSPMETLRAE